MITSFKCLIATVAFILPVIAFAASPVLAATHTQKPHHSSVHKASGHKTHKHSTPATTS